MKRLTLLCVVACHQPLQQGATASASAVAGDAAVSVAAGRTSAAPVPPGESVDAGVTSAAVALDASAASTGATSADVAPARGADLLALPQAWKDCHAYDCCGGPGACAAAGGVCRSFRFEQVACVRRAPDAGAPCSNGSDCRSQACLAPAGAAVGTRRKGTCYDAMIFRDCDPRIEGGLVVQLACE